VLGDSSLDSVDCTSSKFCVAVGWNGAGYYRQGTSWTHGYTVELGAPGMNGILAVSCADRSFCAYVDGNSAVGIGRA
jgi:hypothetical protein